MTPLEQYVASFRARVGAIGGERVDAPGLLGCSLRRGDRPAGRLLVLGDEAADALAPRLAELDIEMAMVLGEAPRVTDLLVSAGLRQVEGGTAMVRPHLDDLPLRDLPDGLELRPVQRTPDEPPGVPFHQAVAAARLFDPDALEVSEEVMSGFLRALPRGRLLAAVDQEGEVRATSASGGFGEEAVVVFVSTDPVWRGRGIGTTMTARALQAAREEGAVRAALEASDLGLPIYRRLGFTSVGPVTRFTFDG